MRRCANAATAHRSCVLTVLLLTAVLTLPSAAAAYSGMLSSADENPGILGTGQWIKDGPTTIEWNVTQNGDGTWHYAYTFTHPEGATSHFILETSDNFATADIWDATGDISEIEIGLHTVGPGNPTMPDDVYGIKFGADGLSTHIEFDSSRLPMWGDFYSKDGMAGGQGMNSAWNAGFTADDSDPDVPVQDGSIDFHILVPNTHYSAVESTSWTAIKRMYR